MVRTRISVRELMAAVLIVALGVAAVLYPTGLWASALFTTAVVLMSTATVGAISRRAKSRTSLAGVSIFGWVYLGLVFGPLPNGNGTTIPPLPPMVLYEYLLYRRLIPHAQAAFNGVTFRNTVQAESVLEITQRVRNSSGKVVVVVPQVDVMQLKRIVHSLGSIMFASIGGLVGRGFASRERISNL
jgi:hypothetical protein